MKQPTPFTQLHAALVMSAVSGRGRTDAEDMACVARSGIAGLGTSRAAPSSALVRQSLQDVLREMFTDLRVPRYRLREPGLRVLIPVVSCAVP
jgi:hypothetical protein